ncbi:hypothetical protein YC2023_021116 [Brassica napus]
MGAFVTLNLSAEAATTRTSTLKFRSPNGEKGLNDKGVPIFLLMALKNNDFTSDESTVLTKSYHMIDEDDPLLEKAIRFREMGDILAELVVAAVEEVVVKDKGDGKKKNKAKRLSKKMTINEKAGGSVRRAVTKFRRRIFTVEHEHELTSIPNHLRFPPPLTQSIKNREHEHELTSIPPRMPAPVNLFFDEGGQSHHAKT